MLIQVKDVPCVTSNPHSGLPLTPFVDFGFNHATHMIRKKIILQDDKDNEFEMPATSTRNGLDYAYLTIIKPGTVVPRSFNMA